MSGMTSQPSMGAIVASLQNTENDTGKLSLLITKVMYICKDIKK